MERTTQPPSRGTLVLKRYRAFPCHVERVIPGPPRRPSGRSALSRDQAAEDRGASCQATEQDSCFGPTYLGRSDHHTPADLESFHATIADLSPRCIAA